MWFLYIFDYVLIFIGKNVYIIRIKYKSLNLNKVKKVMRQVKCFSEKTLSDLEKKVNRFLKDNEARNSTVVSFFQNFSKLPGSNQVCPGNYVGMVEYDVI